MYSVTWVSDPFSYRITELIPCVVVCGMFGGDFVFTFLCFVEIFCCYPGSFLQFFYIPVHRVLYFASIVLFLFQWDCYGDF